MMVFWWIVGIAIGLFIVAEVAFNLYALKVVTPIFERSPVLQSNSAPPNRRAEVFDIPSSSGVMLSACLFQRPETESRGVIVFCPEFGGNKWSCMKYCEGLWEAGFDILAFDFRNSGDSSWQDNYRPMHWVSEYELQDVEAVIAYVRSRDDLRERPIGLFGISRGGSAALAVGARSPQVELIATDSAFAAEPMMNYFAQRWISLYLPALVLKLLPNWHLDLTMRLVRNASQHRHGCRFARIVYALRRAPDHKRVLMISGQADSYVSPEVARAIANAAGPLLEELWIVPKCKHNSARNLVPDQYDARLVRFFSAMSPLREEKSLSLHSSAS